MTKVRPTRDQIVKSLVERDGKVCMHPDCGKAIDPDLIGSGCGKLEPTIDHWYPQSWAFKNGWTYEQVWDLSNLRMMHKGCNAKKGHLVPNEDGTLPPRVRKEFRYRRDKRAQRPEICTKCSAGRDLDYGDVCGACGSGPMPERFPRWAKMPSPECDHELFWCWACSIGIVERVGATAMIMTREGGDE
jgi:hypothetical protein